MDIMTSVIGNLVGIWEVLLADLSCFLLDHEPLHTHSPSVK